MRNLYKILGIDENSHQNEIKNAYKRLAQKYHPDKETGDSDKFIEVKYAYDVLGKTESRVAYDHEYAVYREKVRNYKIQKETNKKLESQWDSRTRFRFGIRKLRTILDQIDEDLSNNYRDYIISSPKDVRYYDTYKGFLIDYFYKRFNNNNTITCFALNLIDKNKIDLLNELDPIVEGYNADQYKAQLKELNKKYNLNINVESLTLIKKPSKIKWAYLATALSYIIYILSTPDYSLVKNLTGYGVNISGFSFGTILGIAIGLNILVLFSCNRPLEIEHTKFEFKTVVYKALFIGASQISLALYKFTNFPIYIQLAKYILIIGMFYVGIRFLRGLYYFLRKRFII